MADLLQALDDRQRALERLAHTLPRSHPLWSKAAGWAQSAGHGQYHLDVRTKRVATDDRELKTSFVVSTRAIDRQGDVLEPKGVLPHLHRYEANPVWLWMHEQSQPLGLATSKDGVFSVKVTDDLIEADLYWHQETQVARDCYALVKADVLRACSVGWLAHKGHKGHKGQREHGDGPFAAMRVTEWELLELTLCAVGANQEALRKSLEGTLCDPVRRYLSPLASLPKGWANGWGPGVQRAKNEFFSECERDDKGRCKPGTGGGAEGTKPPGGKDRPSRPNSFDETVDYGEHAELTMREFYQEVNGWTTERPDAATYQADHRIGMEDRLAELLGTGDDRLFAGASTGHATVFPGDKLGQEIFLRHGTQDDVEHVEVWANRTGDTLSQRGRTIPEDMPADEQEYHLRRVAGLKIPSHLAQYREKEKQELAALREEAKRRRAERGKGKAWQEGDHPRADDGKFGEGAGEAGEPKPQAPPTNYAEAQQQHQEAHGEWAARQEQRDTHREALQACADTDNLPGWTEADQQLMDQGKAIAEAGNDMAILTPEGRQANVEQLDAHLAGYAEHFTSLSEAEALRLETAGADASGVRAAIEKGQAALAKAGEKCKKAQEKHHAVLAKEAEARVAQEVAQQEYDQHNDTEAGEKEQAALDEHDEAEPPGEPPEEELNALPDEPPEGSPEHADWKAQQQALYDPYEQAHEKWQTKRDSLEEKHSAAVDKWSDKEEKLRERSLKADQRVEVLEMSSDKFQKALATSLSNLDDTSADGGNSVHDAATEAAEARSNALDDADYDDPEPDEPDPDDWVEDEPDEPEEKALTPSQRFRLRRKATFREEDHPRADDGQFGQGAGAGKPKKPSKKKRRTGAEDAPADDSIHSYIDPYVNPDPGDAPATADDASTANEELADEGSDYRIVPDGRGNWSARTTEDLEDDLGEDWVLVTNPLTGLPDAGPSDYFDELANFAGDENTAAYLPAMNDPREKPATQEQVDQANEELKDDGSDYRIARSEEYNLWVAVPAEEVEDEDEDEPEEKALTSHRRGVQSRCTQCQEKNTVAALKLTRWQRKTLQSVLPALGLRLKADGSMEEQPEREGEEKPSLGAKFVKGIKAMYDAVADSTDHPDVHGTCEKHSKNWAKVCRKNAWKSVGYPMDDPDDKPEENGTDEPDKDDKEGKKALADLNTSLVDLTTRVKQITGVA